jgi:hypothetical protein
MTFTDPIFSGIKSINSLYLTLTVVAYSQDFSTASTPIPTTIKVSTTNNVMSTTIALASISGLCTPGTTWYWIGIQEIALGDKSGGDTFTDKTKKITYTSVPVAYTAYSGTSSAVGQFTTLIGGELTDDMVSVGYTSVCDTDANVHSDSTTGDCTYVTQLGGTMTLSLTPTYETFTTTATPAVTEDIIVYNVISSNVTSPTIISGLSYTEKMVIGGILLLILLAVIAAIVYYATRPSPTVTKKTVKSS